jgi:hypothetical protein
MLQFHTMKDFVPELFKQECRWKDLGWLTILESGMSQSSTHRAILNLMQVDEDGDSYWVFESRDVNVKTIYFLISFTLHMQPSHPPNPVDSK